MKKGEAYVLNTILAKIKITGDGIASDTRRSVMSSKIAISAIAKRFEEDRTLIQSECSEESKATYYDLVNAMATETVDVVLSKISVEQFDTLLTKVDLTTAEVEVLYEYMLASEVEIC